jgi:hypothetical protein
VENQGAQKQGQKKHEKSRGTKMSRKNQRAKEHESPNAKAQNLRPKKERKSASAEFCPRVPRNAKTKKANA